MVSGGKGLSTFLMTYSLGQGYLDDDDYKKTIEDNVNEKCKPEIKIFETASYKNKLGIFKNREIDIQENDNLM